LIKNIAAAHGFPTDLVVNKQACDKFGAPYVMNCNFDAAGSMFKHIMPFPLQPRNFYWNTAGDLLSFDQQQFFESEITF
jgi:hypothetical protein